MGWSESQLQGIIQPKGFPSLPEDWRAESRMRTSADGEQKLFELRFLKRNAPAAKNRRVLAIVHGMGEHSGRYVHFAHYLKDSIDEIVMIDLRGHGRSTGIRGHVEKFDEYVDDVRAWLESIESRDLHLFGHSMGGLVVLRVCLKSLSLPLASVAVSSPLLAIKVELPIAKRMAAHVVARIWGKLLLANELDPRQISHDVEVVKAYCEDKLVHSLSTPGFYVDLLKVLSDTNDRMKTASYPIAFFVPVADQIVDSSRTLAFAERLKAPERVVFQYEGFFHESFNETEKERPFEDLNRWIQKHSRSRTS